MLDHIVCTASYFTAEGGGFIDSKYEIVSKSTEKIFIDIGFWLVRGNLDKMIVPNSIKLFSNMKFGVKL